MAEYGKNGNTLNLEHLVLKANNAADWDADYVLLAGELGIELDTKKYKMGDGTTKWSALEYYTNPAADSIVSSLTTRVDAIDGTNGRLATIEAKDTEQDGKITALEGKDTAHEGRLDALEAKDTTHESRMSTIESKDTAQDGRLDSAESRLTSLEGLTIISANPFRE